MATNTYVALDKVTVGTATSTVTFSSIPQGYTDLVLVGSVNTSSEGGSVVVRFNSDTGNNYSFTFLYGTGSTAASSRISNGSNIYVQGIAYGSPSAANLFMPFITQIQNYSNTSTYKTVLTRANGNQTAGSDVESMVGLWRNTNAISTITLTNNNSSNFSIGSTFSLYGIAAASVGAKATGGTVYSDSQYYYHVFGSTGTFTPLSSLTADVLVVAGGGGGAATNGAGGGAGGVFYATSQSLTTTGYTCTVGAGGTGGTAASDSYGTSGTNSTFASLTAAVGGGYGGKNAVGANGGSGGGGNKSYAGGSSTQTSTGGTGYGFAGGNGYSAGAGQGGGGGAGAVGGTATALQMGAGGVGTSAFSSWVSATGIGQLVSSTGYIAGGGGGGADARTSGEIAGAGGYGGGGSGSGGGTTNTGNGIAGTANTGGGGGGGGWTTGTVSGGAGGSGVVIVRYLKA